MDNKQLLHLATSNNWKLLCIQDNIGMISFTKEGARINIYTTKMTVATCLNHPKQGKTQMYRKNVSNEELGKIFKNPRVHTGKGYKNKASNIIKGSK
ncbi:MAG: hypothetical protein GY931_00485 [Maribacter sp.]|nr:hypothetical protein [Maribacter sp.]